MIKTIVEQIPILKNCNRVVHINKGFSSDEKYLIQMYDGNKQVLLRTYSLQELDKKKREYSILKVMHEYDVSCSKPLSIGKVGNRGYMITSYIEGKDAEDEIQQYSVQEQYNIGLEA